jgi:hypothetical protein
MLEGWTSTRGFNADWMVRWLVGWSGWTSPCIKGREFEGMVCFDCLIFLLFHRWVVYRKKPTEGVGGVDPRREPWLMVCLYCRFFGWLIDWLAGACWSSEGWTLEENPDWWFINWLLAWQEPGGAGRGWPYKRTLICLLIDWLVGRSLLEARGVDPIREHLLMVHGLIAWQEPTRVGRGGPVQEFWTLNELLVGWSGWTLTPGIKWREFEDMVCFGWLIYWLLHQFVDHL